MSALQGRSSAIFDDRNDGVIDDVIGSAPEVVSMEMETFHLFDLARRSRGWWNSVHSNQYSRILVLQCLIGVLSSSASTFQHSSICLCWEALALNMSVLELFAGKIAASAACLGLMERHTDRVIDMSLVDDKEMRAGISSLRALTQFLL